LQPQKRRHKEQEDEITNRTLYISMS
jgi:hypothetical protein